jgi:retron-type reverse transcriptase
MNILSIISKKLFMSKEELYKFIKSSPHRYKAYYIPKNNNKGKRLIAQPSKNLKYLQQLILKEFFLDLPIHEAAVAYIKGIGIKENARRHCGNQYMLKMDFKNFFPSIKPTNFISYIEKCKDIKLNVEDKNIIKSVFFWSKNKRKNLQLSIGAPSSPYISNVLMFNFDTSIVKLLDKDIIYTRYADDLIFSTNKKNHLFNVKRLVSKVINKEEYKFLNVNETKTKFISKKHTRIVTGLVIDNNGNPSLGRKKKRFIKSLVYKYKNDLLDNKEIFRLQGYLAFSKDVEPVFLIRLEKKYGKRVMDDIKYFKS